ncbi:MAG: glycosyltransferase [Alphaproteobacteria bacterium]|jgi:hypothetical protein|nr:glycosyltransferase [Alphaproteobacteria bacterium]
MSAKCINILTPPLEDQNVRAFLAPILANRGLLADAGLSFHLHQQVTAALTDCEVLILSSSFWRGPWVEHRDRARDLIADLVARGPLVLFFDRASTSGTVNADVLPLVTRYYKTNLLRDRTLYQRPLYGLRQFTDHYHRHDGIVDPAPACSTPVADAAELGKLRLSWNTALANYSLLGPRISALYAHLPLAFLMRPTSRFHPPSADRTIDISCRMGLSYKYETVAYQRRRLAEALARYRRIDRVSKIAYCRELRDAKIVASPFGYSEVNYKDFETFIAGALLLKPDMSHLETYPDLYQEDVTYVAHDWDLDDLDGKIERILDDYPRYLEIARNGQERYRAQTVGRPAAERFVTYFSSLLGEAEAGDLTMPERSVASSS